MHGFQDQQQAKGTAANVAVQSPGLKVQPS